MNCRSVEELLLEYVDGELDESQARKVRAHLDGCPACMRSLKETQELLGVIEEVRASRSRSLATVRATPPAAPVMCEPARPGSQMGDFEILDEIGRGGMGVVYRARQVSLNRIVALKVLSATVCSSEKAVARFRNEARAAAKLHHTHIVPVYAQGECEGHCYYAMELIEGQSLDRVLAREPDRVSPGFPGFSGSARSRSGAGGRTTDRLGARPSSAPVPTAPGGSGAAVPPAPATESAASRSQSCRPDLDARDDDGAPPDVAGHRIDYRALALMVAHVAEGLEHAHRSGVIHRDVKPQNLLLGRDGQLHITDFGLARLLDEVSVTVTGEMLGTPAYMSPEQITGRRGEITHQTDVYSLGVTLYELLARRRPFEGATREQVIARICTDEPKSPRKHNPALPIDLETICLRAIEKDRRRRYTTAGAMAADLRRYAEDRPIVSRRVGPIEKGLKWIRRHRALTAVLALSLALLLTVLVWTRQTVIARHNRADRLVQEAFDLLAYEDYRDPASARLLLERARPLGPNPSAYRIARALTRLLDDPRAAIDDLRQAVAEEPGNPDNMYLLAWALRRDEQHQACRDWISQAASLGGARTAAGHFFHAQAMVRTSPDEAIEAYRQASLKRENYAQALIHYGRALNHWMYHHRKHERFSEQVRSLESACTLQGRKAYPRYLLSIAYRLSAEIYEQAGDVQAAERHFAEAFRCAKEAQAAEPTSPQGFACEAEYWESRGDDHRAIESRNQGAPYCTSRLDQIELRQYRWRLYYWVGDLAKAREDLAELGRISLDTDPRRAWYVIFFPALLEAEAGRIKPAIESVRLAVTAHPEDARKIIDAACMLRILGDPTGAAVLLAGHDEGDVSYTPPQIGCLPIDWPREVYAFCRGSLDWEALQRKAEPYGDNRLLWSCPLFIRGAAALADGDRATALREFEACERTYDYDNDCHLARVFVRKMKNDLSWPSWIASHEDASR